MVSGKKEKGVTMVQILLTFELGTKSAAARYNNSGTVALGFNPGGALLSPDPGKDNLHFTIVQVGNGFFVKF
jgi:hypothetical protein